jgi:hypothetical protein
MTDVRTVLKDQSFFIVDDLTRLDLIEKRKWSTQVSSLYKNGVRLKFFAGKWRKNGVPFTFQSESDIPASVS